MSNEVKAYHAVILAGTGERKAPVRIKLFDLGDNRMARGPVYRLADPAAVAAASLRESTDLVIDYEHASDLKASQGDAAPAAGWIKKLAAEADGLYAEVEWTERARAMIEAGEYRYVSPTFMANKNTGVIQYLLRAGLTNAPAFDLPALANAFHTPHSDDQEKDPMDETLKAALCSLLGLDPAKTGDAALVTAADRLKGATLLSAHDVKRIGEALGTEDTVTGAVIVASLRGGDAPAGAAGSGGPDPSKYVEVGVMKSVQEELGSVKKQLASLEADRGKDAAEAKVAAAIRDGKLVPGQKDWALTLASSDMESFDAYIAGAPTILDGGRSVTLATTGKGESGLTSQQKAICSQLGMSEATYLGKDTGGKDTGGKNTGGNNTGDEKSDQKKAS